MKQSFLEQVSQCQTKTPPGFFLPCNLMGISFPHTLDRNQDMRIGSHCHGHSVMILHHLLSQQAVIFFFPVWNLYAERSI